MVRFAPEVIVERLQEVQKTGIERIFGAFGFPGLPQWKVKRSIELFCVLLGSAAPFSPSPGYSRTLTQYRESSSCYLAGGRFPASNRHQASSAIRLTTDP